MDTTPLNARLGPPPRKIGAVVFVTATVLAFSLAWGKEFSEADRAYWAFAPLKNPAEPGVKKTAWVTNPIDAFILEKIEAAGLSPSPEADRRTLIRRVYFDLIGLPPTGAEVESFVADSSDRAYEKVVDRLLQSPRYGERQARLWLDLVRYADSDGYKSDLYRPNVWRYRDYVIESFNRDKPYDRFITEQLAGDEVFPDDPAALVATGYLRLWPYEDNQADVRRQWEAILDDITDVTGQAVLGLGVGCARCHDHKYDPILQADYYRLQAFFTGFVPRNDLVLATEAQRAEHREKQSAWEAATAAIREAIEAIEKPAIEKMRNDAITRYPKYLQEIIAKPDAARTPVERQYVQLSEIQTRQRSADFSGKLSEEQRKRLGELKEQLKAFDAMKPAPLPAVVGVGEVGPVASPTEIPGKKGAVVEPGVFAVLGDSTAGEIKPIAGKSTGRRAAFAAWMFNPGRGMTARAIVNRLWQQHFGAGIVATPNDFGRQGSPPTHPELLDWLAQRLVAEGWSLKKIHRLMVTSATYRQASVVAPSSRATQADPKNRLLWRMPVRRLEAEQVRDSLLAVSGELDLTAGGEGAEGDAPRRSVYLRQMRNKPDGLLATLDLPDMFNSCGRRSVTTTPLQALTLVNGAFTAARAEKIAQTLRKSASGDVMKTAEDAYRLILSRPPTEGEREAARAFFGDTAPVSDETLIDFCHTLLNSNAFIYVD